MISWETLVLTNVVLIIFYVIYHFVKQKLSHTNRRFTLLMLPIMAIAAVLGQTLFSNESSMINIPVIEMEAITVQAGAEIQSSTAMNWQWFYVIGIVGMLLFLIYKVVRLFYYFRKAVPLFSEPKIKVLFSDDQDSFSFFNFIHLSAELEESERDVVLEHELLHYKKSHSLDLILMEIYHALFWFNPIMIVMKRELIQTHEFEVDQVLYKKYNDAYLGHLLSYALGTSVAHLLLTSQFYKKMTLAQRIEKMKFNKNSNRFAMLIIPGMALVLGLTSWTYSNEQTSAISPYGQYETEPDGDIDNKPQYKGGQEALVKFMTENVKYPKEAEKKDIQGTVYVKFVVETNGSLSGVEVEKGVHKLLDAEALRVVKMMPDWIPGKKDGKPVKTEMTLPITFKL